MTTPPQESTLPDPEPEPDREPDGTLDSEELDPDEPPKGDWLDNEEVVANLTEHEAEEGKTMGEQIDTGDDQDGGG